MIWTRSISDEDYSGSADSPALRPRDSKFCSGGTCISSMPCKNVASFVANSGAVVLRTGPHNYNLYVSTSDYCSNPQGIVPAFVPTRDSRACFIGYTCSNQGPSKGDKSSS